MKLFKFLAITTALAIAGMGSAHAADEYFLVPTATTTPGDDNIYFDIDIATNGQAGQSFDDIFIFNTPDTRDISAVLYGMDSLVYFKTIDLMPSGFGTSPNFTTGISVGPFVDAGGVTLTSGVYEIEVTGTYLTSDATLGGSVDATPAVPEPGNWALMLAGLGAMGAVVRRRKQG